MKLWSGYVTAVNTEHFPAWTSEESLRGFLGTFQNRLDPGLYVRISGYITAFILSPLGVMLAALGCVQAWKRRATETGIFIISWCGSLIVYVLVWGVASPGQHNYYNLPFLVPASMLLAMGVVPLLRWIREKTSTGFTGMVVGALAVGCIVPMTTMSAYLFREDRVLMAAAEWIRSHVPAGEPVAVKLNHNPHYIDYMHVPTVSYYSGHLCFMLTPKMPKEEYVQGLQECRYIVETLPTKRDGMSQFAMRFKNASRPIDSLAQAKKEGFVAGEPIESEIRIWTKNQ